MIVANLLTLAKKISVHLLDATTTWDTTTSHKVTVPAGKRWILQNLFVWRTVSSTCTIRIRNVADEQLSELLYAAAAISGLAWPQGTGVARSLNIPGVVMDAGEYIDFIFGVAQDASAFISYSVLEVDV